ncbi:hypothetical protein BDV93DRAFT_522506 [Ceratobasidium sp. AG-I]|nr:hypothetical protein BDV93DRAFT_522506 [Ceratobasidium sp. AG-I]
MPSPIRRSTLPQDLPFIKKVMEMFLVNDMNGAEAECQNQKSTEPTLYINTASSLMRSMRALMSFESEDIADAQKMVLQTLTLANENRLSMSWTSRLASFAYNASLSNVQQMDIDQLHSELIYAECLLEKAIMGFVSSGDWMSFLREALNIRSVVSIYRTLNTFLEQYDELAKRQTPSVPIDADFRSGVYLGMGMSLLVFSMIPSRIVIFAGLLGYKGDRFEALRLLRRAGGWGDEKGNPDHNQKVPRVSKEAGGARRALCDLVLVIFHLVISGFTREGVDVKEAENIVEWNLKQYPGSIFFLFGKGRLHVTRSQPDQAIAVYKEAQTKVEGQRGYQQLGSVMDWEMALCNLALGDWRAGAESFDKLRKSAKWSKSTYIYGRAACLLQCADITPAEQNEADQMMKDVHNHLQRIAGKSIPLEKFVARKAERYLKEGKLVAPALELAYMLQATNRTTLEALNKHKETLEALTKTQLTEDDRQLVNLLLGVTLRHIENPHAEDMDASNENQQAKASDPKLAPSPKQAESEKLLREASRSGQKLAQEHYVAYFAYYELGRLYEDLRRWGDARSSFNRVTSDLALEGPLNARRGKYSLQNAIVLRANASIATLPTDGHSSPTKSREPQRSGSFPGAFDDN